MSQFGWIAPSDEKRLQNDNYRLRSVYAAPVTVEKQLVYPDYVAWYDQGNIGSCTGFSASWATSIYNNPNKYNGYWLYKQGQKDDGDSGTSNDNDGGYVWAVMDVLRKRGHALNKTTTPIPAEGIQSYYWCKTIDEIRAAIDADRVPVFGIYWFSEFSSPRTVNGEFWIGTRSNWGYVQGGHAICCMAASDKRQAVRLLNSWGSSYPPVWISYASIVKLLGMQGECAVGLDIAPIPPPPPPEPETKAFVVSFDNFTYSGVLTRK